MPYESISSTHFTSIQALQNRNNNFFFSRSLELKFSGTNCRYYSVGHLTNITISSCNSIGSSSFYIQIKKVHIPRDPSANCTVRFLLRGGAHARRSTSSSHSPSSVFFYTYLGGGQKCFNFIKT